MQTEVIQGKVVKRLTRPLPFSHFSSYQPETETNDSGFRKLKAKNKEKKKKRKETNFMYLANAKSSKYNASPRLLIDLIINFYRTTIQNFHFGIFI